VTVAAFVLIVAAVLVMVLVHWRTQKRADARHALLEEGVAQRQRELHDADEDRQRALQKMHKHHSHRTAELANQTQVLAERANATLEEARLMHSRVDGFFRDRRVQRMLDEGVSGREPAREGTDVG
jgi:hypothetical protein